MGRRKEVKGPPATGERRAIEEEREREGPTHDEIARRAYDLYQARGGSDGDDVQDWLRAERELRDERQRFAPRERTELAERG